MDSRFDEDNNLETQVIFGHLESTLAVRCLARNEMAAVSREIKLVSSGKSTHFLLSFFGLHSLHVGVCCRFLWGSFHPLTLGP